MHVTVPRQTPLDGAIAYMACTPPRDSLCALKKSVDGLYVSGMYHSRRDNLGHVTEYFGG